MITKYNYLLKLKQFQFQIQFFIGIWMFLWRETIL